jgi:hypothetical protein
MDPADRAGAARALPWWARRRARIVKPVSFEATLAMLKTVDGYWLVMNERPDLRAGRPAAG